MGGRGERGEEAGGERDGRWFCGGGSGRWSFFYPAPFCWHPQHGHLRVFAKLIVTGQTIFVVSRKWFSSPVLLGSTKRFAIFAQQKNQQRGLTSGAIWHIIMASCFSALLLCWFSCLSSRACRSQAFGDVRFFLAAVSHVPDIRVGDITVRLSQHPPCPPCALSYHVPCAPAAYGVLLSRLGTQRSPSPREQRHPAHPSAWR